MNALLRLARIFKVFTLVLLGNVALAGSLEQRPNILLILVDDLGLGDVHAYNMDSSIGTPNIDRLAAEGLRFTDGHSNSAVCTPTRYGLLTGRYAWRTRLKRSVLFGYSPALIPPNQMTLASLLKQRGYFTAMVGKWHLGLDWQLKPGATVEDPVTGGEAVDFNRPFEGGPRNIGFDYFFGIAASLDMPPYTYIENDRVTVVPEAGDPEFGRPGYIAQGFRFKEVGYRLMDAAREVVREAAESEHPFFLYYSLTSPHKPLVASPEFDGSSGLGDYGDYVAETDYWIGAVLAALEDSGQAGDTLVIVTSDNGSLMQTWSSPWILIDHANWSALPYYKANRHDPSFGYRGYKSDIWEGGHRVPFIVRWPGHVAPGEVSDHLVSTTDLLATLAEVVDYPLRPAQRRDSESFLPVLKGEQVPQRAPMILHSFDGMFALRDDEWKLILGDGSGGWTSPQGSPGQQPYQLYNLAQDPAERHNLVEEQTQRVNSMLENALTIIGDDAPDLASTQRQRE